MSEDNNDEPKKVFRILDGGKLEAMNPGAGDDEPGIPQNDYVIVDIWGEEHFASGFLLFTSQHVAVMRDQGDGALPIIVFPLGNVKYAVLDEEDLDEVQVEMPF